MTTNGIDRTGVAGGSGGTRAAFVDEFLDADTVAQAYDALGISAFAQTLLDDASANAFLTTLTTTRSETGAVAVSVLNKLRERFSVKDFGATGDGVTNDTTAIQAAATAVRLAGGGTLFFPLGTYLIDQSILIGANTRCIGEGDSTVIKAHQSAFIGTNANNNCYLFRNFNHTVSSLTDSDITIESMTFDYGSVTIASGGAHCIAMRYVDRVTVRDVRGVKGENVTAFQACRDTVTDSTHGVDQSNCFFDHWDGAGNCKVVHCTGRTSVNIAQGIQFTGTGSAGEDRTSAEAVVAFCSLYGVRHSVSHSASAIIANANDADSSTFRFTSIGNYVEDSDLGLVFSGEGGQHISLYDTFKGVDQLPVFLQTANSDDPDNCRIVGPHLIDCDHSVGNVALISIAGTKHNISGVRITNTGAAAYDLIAWFTSAATDCVVEIERGDDGGSGVVQNDGTRCTLLGRHTVAFHAVDDSGTSYGVGPTNIGFNGEQFDSLSNFATPTFTAPVAGRYRFSWRLMHKDTVTAADLWDITLVTTAKNYVTRYRVAAAQYGTVCGSTLANMAAGDTAKLTITRSGGAGNFPLHNSQDTNSFDGMLEVYRG